MFYYWTVCAPETLQKFNFMQLAGEIGLACRSSRNLWELEFSMLFLFLKYHENDIDLLFVDFNDILF